MPLEKNVQSNKEEAAAVVEPEEMAEEAPKKGEPDIRPGNQGVPSKSLLESHPETHPGALSPGQYAEEVVGYSDAEPGSDEARKHGEEFSKAKMRRRLGT